MKKNKLLFTILTFLILFIFPKAQALECDYEIKNTKGSICKLKISIVENDTLQAMIEQEPGSGKYVDYAKLSVLPMCDGEHVWWDKDDKFEKSQPEKLPFLYNQFIELSKNANNCPNINQKTFIYRHQQYSNYYSSLFNKDILGIYFTSDTSNENINSSDKDENINDKNNEELEEIKDFFLGKTICGGVTNFTFPEILPKTTSLLYNLLKISIPVIIVIKGMMDMFKATTAGKEDEMKKAQKKFVQRLIAGACALLTFIIVETVINFIADKTGNSGAIDCVNCFINNECQKI